MKYKLNKASQRKVDKAIQLSVKRVKTAENRLQTVKIQFVRG